MKEIIVVLLSSFKFAMTFPVAIIQFKFGYMETLLWTNVGGFLGILFFAFLSEIIIKAWNKYVHPYFRKRKKPRPPKKLFTPRNRKIARIKSKYGLAGIAAITPFLLSIPVGVFLVIRYFRNEHFKILYLLMANFVWSLIYTLFYSFCQNVIIETWLG